MNHTSNSSNRRPWVHGLALALPLALTSLFAQAADPIKGKQLYDQDCAGCHGANPLTSNVKHIFEGRNSYKLNDLSIDNVATMRFLRRFYPKNGTELNDMAAYLGNTPTKLTFAATAVGGTSNAMMVTVYAPPVAGNALGNIAVTAEGDFIRQGGTCGVTLNVGQNCTVGVVFKPTASGAREGKLLIAHNQIQTPVQIVLAGTASGTAPTAPVAAVSPASLSFAATPVGGTSAAQNVTVQNTGNAALSMTAATFSSADYFVSGGTCAVPGSVAAGASCTLSVALRPASGAAGARNATLTLAHNGGSGSSTVALTGSASAATTPTATLTSTLNFGSINVGSTSGNQTATLSNGGAGALSITSIGTGSSEFQLKGGTCAAGGSVAAGSSCTILVGFAPNAAGARTGSLTVAHNAAGGSSSSALSGTGVSASAAVSVTPSSLSFSQTINTTSSAQTVTVSNTGTAALGLGAITLGGVHVDVFRVAGGSCVANGSIAAGSSCTVSVEFSPKFAGAHTATLQVAHNAGGSPVTVSLAGTGNATPLPTIALNASSLSFGNQGLNTNSAVQTVTVRNSGAANLTLGAFTLTGHDGDFVRSGSCATGGVLTPNSTCTLGFAFRPQAAGARSATLSIASDASNGAAVLNLGGTGAAAASAGVAFDPSAVDFGNVTVGSTSVARSVTLSNTGSAALSITGLVASNGFKLVHNCGSSLAANGSCRADISFEPTAMGDATGTLTLSSNAAGSPHTVALSGAGVTSASVLSWANNARSLDFGNGTVGEAAVTRLVTLVNQGPGPVTLNQITLAGANGSEFVIGSGSSCQPTLEMAAGESCLLSIGFQPGGVGARAASLQVASSGTNPADLSLSGTGSGAAQAAMRLTPLALNFTAEVDRAAAPQELTLQSTGNAVLRVTALRVASGNFTLDTSAQGGCQAVPFDLMPGQSCKLAVGWSSMARGAETGMIEVAANAGATPMQVPVTASRGVTPPAATITTGGCSIGGRSGPADPTLWLLVGAALLVLWRRQARR